MQSTNERANDSLRTIKECNINPADNYGKYGGTVTDTLNCGVYTFTPKVVEDVACNKLQNPYDSSHAIDWEHHAAGAIEQYCNRDLTLDPDFIRDPTQFYETTPEGESQDNYYKDPNTNNDIGYVIFSKNQFLDNVGCLAGKAKHKTGGPECKRKLYKIFDKCK